MPTAKPFTYVVRFTIAPIWMQDGFTLSNDRALLMLAGAIGAGSADELQAKVLEAPSALEIARIQGYDAKHPRSGQVVRDIMAEHGEVGVVRNALIKARDLLSGVAFVATEGDTNDVLDRLRDALATIDARQGERVEIEA